MNKQFRELTAKKAILWKDRKRHLGLPLSFTRYSADEDRLYIKTGFFTVKKNETLLYRILDIQTSRTLGQRLLGVGTVTLFNADTTDKRIELKNIRHPDQVHRFLSTLVENERKENGIAGREIVGFGSMMDDHHGAAHHDHDDCDHDDCDCHDGK